MKKTLNTYRWKKWLYIYWISCETESKNYIELAGLSFTEDKAVKKMCKHLGIAYKGPDSDGK